MREEDFSFLAKRIFVRRVTSCDGMDIEDGNDQADRGISTGKLNVSPRLHTRPINVVVFHASQGNTRFEVGFPA